MGVVIRQLFSIFFIFLLAVMELETTKKEKSTVLFNIISTVPKCPTTRLDRKQDKKIYKNKDRSAGMVSLSVVLSQQTPRRHSS